MNAARPAQGTAASGTRPARAAQAASMTATQPLAASPSSVRTAAVLLPLRRTLVAPGLPEPKLRGSRRPIIRLTSTANDTEPIRYPKARTMMAAAAADRLDMARNDRVVVWRPF